MTKLSVSPAVRSSAKLREAVSKLRAVKADASVVRACKGRIVKVSDRMTTERMTIQAFLTFIENVKPIKVQRNDLYRLNHGLAKHLDKLALPQCAFALVYFEDQFYLVDGNHRKRAWLNQPKRQLPSHVQLTVMVVDTLEEGKRIYGCYDSKNAKKGGRDDVLSMLHDAGVHPDTWKSKLIAGGKFRTVLQYMTRALLASAASNENMKEVAVGHIDAFKALDRHGLDEGEVVGGGVWAALRLYQELPAVFHQYVCDYVEDLRRLDTSTESLANPMVIEARDRAHRACRAEECGTSGSKAIPVMFPEYLVGFFDYAKARVRAGTVNVKFRAFVNKLLWTQVVNPDVQKVKELMLTKSR